MSEPTPEQVTSAALAICAACGATVTGKFCSHCGASAELGPCPSCRQPLSPGARFCHRCGVPVREAAEGAGGAAGGGKRRERVAWSVAAIAVLLAVALLLWLAGSFRPAAAPEMGNAGNGGAGGAGLSNRAPDISNMTPAQRFEALFDRIERAGANGDSVTAQQFSPMALGAYAMLDSTNNDFRFDAALLHLGVGELAAALALADTIARQVPGHLFAELIRGEAAARQSDSSALRRAYRDFLAHYDAELRAGRPEYAEHQPLLDDFRSRAQKRER